MFDKGIVFNLKQNSIPGNLSNLLSSFLRNRKQRVVLNGQTSSWIDINKGLPQGSILGRLLFLYIYIYIYIYMYMYIYIYIYIAYIYYIYYMYNGLSSNAKLFAFDTSSFSVVYKANATAKEVNKDLVKINS